VSQPPRGDLRERLMARARAKGLLRYQGPVGVMQLNTPNTAKSAALVVSNE
jgi:hypothetical protein